jgi:hypothetical protein
MPKNESTIEKTRTTFKLFVNFQSETLLLFSYLSFSCFLKIKLARACLGMGDDCKFFILLKIS